MAFQLLDIKLLEASVDAETESDFRILIDNKFVKYITIDAGVFSSEDMCFEPTLINLLPPLPLGGWKQSRISRHPATGQAYVSAVSYTPLPGIRNTWHFFRVEYLELQMGRQLRSNVYEATCPHFRTTIVAKFARFAWEVPQLGAETAAYEWIYGHQIGPEFLGHLTEEGRVIGFIMARVTDCRHATPEDFTLCHLALSRLHQLGIKHGDVNKHNFLIHDGKAVIIDFDNASRGASVRELQNEVRDMENLLHDTSGIGGEIVESGSAIDGEGVCGC